MTGENITATLLEPEWEEIKNNSRIIYQTRLAKEPWMLKKLDEFYEKNQNIFRTPDTQSRKEINDPDIPNWTPEAISSRLLQLQNTNADLKWKSDSHWLMIWIILFWFLVWFITLIYTYIAILPWYREDYVKAAELQNTKIEILEKNTENLEKEIEDAKTEIQYLRWRIDRVMENKTGTWY